MSDPLRTDGRTSDDAGVGSDRDAKIEQLLLVGLDHYFAAHYELAINVWTRALFLDRSHARARAYIERARSALAERQRESEELLQNGVAAFRRGDGDEARRLLQAAIDSGAPSEEALAVLDRMNRLETAALPATAARSDRRIRDEAPRAAGRSSAVGRRPRSRFSSWAPPSWRWPSSPRRETRSTGARWSTSRAAPDAWPRPPRPSPRRSPASPRCRCRAEGRRRWRSARALAASGHLHDALAILESIRPTDPQKADAERLRGDIQRQLLALTTLPAAGAAGGREDGPARSMKCPKCGYLGFEHVERCRNCGYDFSLSSPASQSVPDLPLRATRTR